MSILAPALLGLIFGFISAFIYVEIKLNSIFRQLGKTQEILGRVKTAAKMHRFNKSNGTSRAKRF